MNDLMVYFVALIDVRFQKEMVSASSVYGCNAGRGLYTFEKMLNQFCEMKTISYLFILFVADDEWKLRTLPSCT